MARRASPALVLQLWEYGESSQIVSLLTRDHGRVRGLAKGSLRGYPSARERFSGGFELFTRGQLLWMERPDEELSTLMEWNLEEDRHLLRADWRGQRTAALACELSAAFLGPHDPHPALFDALDGCLNAPLAPGVLPMFLALLLRETGHAPRLDCLADGSLPPKTEVLAFDPEAGGLIVGAGSPDWRMRPETAFWLRQLFIGECRDEGETARRGERFLLAWCRHLLGDDPPALRAFLQGRG